MAHAACPTFTKVCYQVSERASALFNCGDRGPLHSPAAEAEVMVLQWTCTPNEALLTPPLTLYQWQIGVLCVPLPLLCPRVPCGHCLGLPWAFYVRFPSLTPAPNRLASGPGEQEGHTSKSPECHPGLNNSLHLTIPEPLVRFEWISFAVVDLSLSF